MAGCEGTGDDRGVSSSRWGKAQARWQTHNRGTLDFTRSEGWEHCRTSDWKRSEEHTSELQSQSNLVCRLLLEKKKKRPRTSCVESIQRRNCQSQLVGEAR